MRDLGIYLDNNATTAVDEDVVEAMLPSLRESYGNPASLHAFGEAAARTVETARAAVARLIGARSPAEIVFTSGGTESNNAAILGVLSRHEDGIVLSGATEHPSVARPLEEWAARGFAVERVAVNGDGRLDVGALTRRIDTAGDRVRLVTVHWANNETGVMLTEDELRALGETTRSHGIPLHVDAVQAPGKIPMQVADLGIDLLSISAHKLHGPKGVGALYVRGGGSGPPAPLLLGGPQEAELRAGTHNVPGISGFGRAADLARRHAADPAARDGLLRLRDRLEAGLLEAVPGTRVNGAGAPRLDNTASLTFPDVDGELLLTTLAAEGLAVSSGSACSASSRKPSQVLLAMGLSDDAATRTLRFSLSRRTTAPEIEAALALVPRVHAELLALSTV